MKTLNKKLAMILFLTLFLSSQILIGQEKSDSVTDVTPTLALGYLNTSNDTVILTAAISVRREAGSFALQNAEIDFSVSTDLGVVKLGKVKADDRGNAAMKIALKQMPVDKEGKTTYTAAFAGKGKYLANSESLSFKQAKLQISFTQEDSIHMIHVKAVQLEANKELKPISGETVNVYVPRMLSNLKVGEITLDDNGMGSVEFTGGLVGDSLGKITIYAMLEENDNFGTVRGEAAISWGIPKQYYTAEKPTRELWTPVAPVWMIITLIIMLAGVWAHYVYAVIQLVIIKRIGKEQEKRYF